MKGIFLLAFAIFIDGLQAGISFSIAVIAAFPGTTGGCAIGGYFGGKIGCFVLGVLGSIPLINGLLATATVPLGLMLGFVINLCISLTMGVGLIFALFFAFGRPSGWVWGVSIADLIPGVNNLPFWTLMVIRAWWVHASQEGKLGMVGAAATVALSTTRGIMNVKEATMDLPKVKETLAAVGIQQERAPQPQTGQDTIQLAKERAVMQDIRPKPI
jgi:hypothetical protein